VPEHPHGGALLADLLAEHGVRDFHDVVRKAREIWAALGPSGEAR
jgi:hypothetical protein